MKKTIFFNHSSIGNKHSKTINLPLIDFSSIHSINLPQHTVPYDEKKLVIIPHVKGKVEV